jgi:hypothetical protein
MRSSPQTESRHAFLIASAVLVGIAEISRHADAANYPWCARYAKDGGGESCGFTCMATVSGIGGYCALNTQYVPPPGSPTLLGHGTDGIFAGHLLIGVPGAVERPPKFGLSSAGVLALPIR